MCNRLRIKALRGLVDGLPERAKNREKTEGASSRVSFACELELRLHREPNDETGS